MKKVKIFMAVIMLVVVIGINSSVLATNFDNVNAVIINDPNQTLNSTTNTNLTNIPKITNNTNTTQKTNNTTNTYANNKLPQTGTQDYIILFFVVAFAVSAIYAYKKIRDYKGL